MTLEELKAKLSEKITSKSVIDDCAYHTPYEYSSQAQRLYTTHSRSSETWWDRREALRLALGVYETSEVLRKVNDEFPFFAHISKEDKNMVAYTPDRQSGEADRQLRLSIGKLLARVYPCLSEDDIREKIETHNAEINPNIIFYSGIDIAKCYLEEGGISSCMAADPGNSAKAWTIENIPALAYDTPGIKLAVIRSDSGKMLARCLTVEINGEKRYIRNYGSPVLKHWLIKNDYVCGNWNGVQFRTIKKSGGYLMPYLDADGGQSTTNGSTVGLIDGVITGLDRKLRDMFRERGLYTGTPCTTGVGALGNLDSTEFKGVCALSGATYNKLTDCVVNVWMPDSEEFKPALESALSEYYYRVAGGNYAARADMIELGYTRYVNNEKELAKAGYYKLAESLYPEDRTYHDKHRVQKTESGYVLAEDCVIYVSGGVQTKKHKSEITKKDVSLAKVGSYKVYCAPDEKFYVTGTKAKVMPEVHNVNKLWDGSYEYSRNTVNRVIGGFQTYMRKSDNVEEVIKTCQIKNLETLTNSKFSAERVKYALRNAGFMTHYMYNFSTLDSHSVSLGKKARESGCSRISLNTTLDLTMQELLALFNLGVTEKGLAFELTRRWLVSLIADAEAVEAPHYLSDAAPAPILEILTAQPAEIPSEVEVETV